MTPNDVRKYFKTGWRMFKKTGMSATCLSNWEKNLGYVPMLSQSKLEAFTNGELKASYEDYLKGRNMHKDGCE